MKQGASSPEVFGCPWDFCPETCSSRDELKLHWSAYHKPYARKTRVTGAYRPRQDGGWDPAVSEAARPLADELPLPPSQSVIGDITTTTTTTTTTNTETTDVSIVLGSLPSLPAPPSLPQFSQAETIPSLSQPASIALSQEQAPTPERPLADTAPSSPVGETSTSDPPLPATTAAAGHTSDSAPTPPQASTPVTPSSQVPAASTLWYQAYLSPRRSQRIRLTTPSQSRTAPLPTSSALASVSTSSTPAPAAASSQSQPSSSPASPSSRSNGASASVPAPSPFVPPTQASISLPPEEEDPSIVHDAIAIKTPPPHPATPLPGDSDKQPGGGTPGSRSNRKRPASGTFKLKFGDAIEPKKQQTTPSKDGVGFRFSFGSAKK